MESRLDRPTVEMSLWLGEKGYHDGLHGMFMTPREIRRVINFLNTLTDEDLEEIWYMNVDITLKGENDE